VTWRQLTDALLFRLDGSSVSTLFDARRLTRECSEIVELGPPNAATPNNLELLHTRRSNQKRALYTDAMTGNASNAKRAIGRIWSMRADDDALKYLDSLSSSLDDFRVHAHGVAFRKLGQWILSLRGEESIDFRHLSVLPRSVPLATE
jgi:hypothetical protein